MRRVLIILLAGILSPFLFGQTKTEMRIADLPKTITDYIARNAKDFTIDKAFKVDSKSVITYDLLLVHGTEKAVFIFDKDGKFLKKADRTVNSGVKTAPVNPLQHPPADKLKPAPKK